MPVVPLRQADVASKPRAKAAEGAPDVDVPAGRERDPAESADVELGWCVELDQEQVGAGVTDVPARGQAIALAWRAGGGTIGGGGAGRSRHEGG